QCSTDFLYKEWIPPGAPIKQVAQSLRQLIGSYDRLDYSYRRRLIERTEIEESVILDISPVERAFGTAGGDDHQRVNRQETGDALESFSRGVVSPVPIFEQYDSRRRPGVQG